MAAAGTAAPAPTARFRYPGRRAVDDRVVLAGIIWVLRRDVPWRQLPASCGVSGVTCWRRLRDWQTAGVWQALHERLLAELCAAGRLTCTRRSSAPPRCTRSKGEATGPSPVNRGHAGSKHHLITDRGGLPPAVLVTGANRHDVTQLTPLVEAIPPVRGRRGRPRRRPRYLLADRAYDHRAYRRALAGHGITALLAGRGTAHGSGLGRQRWPVERTFAWLHRSRRLRTRWERRADLHHALLSLACSIICLRKLRGSF